MHHGSFNWTRKIPFTIAIVRHGLDQSFEILTMKLNDILYMFFFSFYHFTALETKPHWTLFQILCCNRSHVEVEKESALCTISGKYGTNHFMATFLKLRNWPLLLRSNGLSRSIFAKRCIYSISLRKLRNGPLVQTMPKFSFTYLSIQWLLCITPWLIHNHYHKWVQSSF